MKASDRHFRRDPRTLFAKLVVVGARRYQMSASAIRVLEIVGPQSAKSSWRCDHDYTGRRHLGNDEQRLIRARFQRDCADPARTPLGSVE
jgi:hypothetical protein